MLFNSWEFILVFLPVVLAGYYLLPLRWSVGWLVLGSLFYYGWWNPAYLGLILGSSLFNYVLGQRLCGDPGNRRLLTFGVVANLGLLGYFKYAGFLLENLALVAGSPSVAVEVTLPLAISFYTFFQIAYLVDASQGKVDREPFLNYLLFVTYFPHLIAGPIVHHRELMPQFREARLPHPAANIVSGLALFALAMFKKVGIADGLGVHADRVFAAAEAGGPLSTLDAWTGVLAYSFQIYFDFSAYCEMAIATSWMLGIRLPLNFLSPYRAVSIIDFWRRWHMTLSRFLRDYLYIPLGGNRLGRARRYRNLMLTMLLGGLWHGAGWNFVLWGAIHGALLVLAHAWRDGGLVRLPVFLTSALTFAAVCFAWIFFRAETLDGALHLLSAMGGHSESEGSLVSSPVRLYGWMLLAALGVWAMPSLVQLFRCEGMFPASDAVPEQASRAPVFRRSAGWALLVGGVWFAALYCMASGTYVEFIYRFF